MQVRGFSSPGAKPGAMPMICLESSPAVCGATKNRALIAATTECSYTSGVPVMIFEDAHFLARCLRYRFHTERLPLQTLMLLNLKGGTVALRTIDDSEIL